jgi:D-amino-acid dehydrogenase
MKIAVIGAGIVGMTTAYELAKDGHAVSIFERNASIAEEASFACSGHQGGSLFHPLAFPLWPSGSRLRSLLTPSGISFGRGTTLREVQWLRTWKSVGDDFDQRFVSAQALAAYSLQRQFSIAAQASLGFEQSPGQLVLFKSESAQLALQERLTRLTQLGAVGKLLTPTEVRTLEPALDANLEFHSGIYFAQDGVGNCRQFAHLLKAKILESGGDLHFGARVTALSASTRPEISIQDKGPLSFDRVVICTGSNGSNLYASALRHLPFAHVASASVSAQIREPLNAPRSAVVDWHSQTSISRIGARIRISGGAALGHPSGLVSERTQKRLFESLQSHFPGAADYSRSMQIWQGVSTFSPDALPLIGASAQPGIWLNLAHGHNGWSMACGAARIIADQVGGKSSDIDTTKFHPDRFKA